MKAFVDTNVPIDFVCNRDTFYEDAELIFSYALAGKIEVCFSDISVINTLYVGKKYSYTVEELASQLKELLLFCNISVIDTTTMLKALSSEWKDKEDATQYFCAFASNADVIITRNIKDFTLSEIKVATPSDFLLTITTE